MAIAGIVLTLIGAILYRRSRAAASIPGLAGLILLAIVGTFAVAESWLFPSDYDNPRAAEELRTADLAPISTKGGNDWWQWRGPNRDGTAPAIRENWDAKPPAKLWDVPCGPGYSSPIVADGKVYVQDRQGDSERILCLDADDGKERWSYTYPTSYDGLTSHTNGPRATPAVFDGRVYVVGVRGTFLCLEADPADGKAKMLWEHDLRAEYAAPLPAWGIAGSPLIEDDIVIVQPGGRKGGVVAFDRKTGEPRWTCLSDPAGYCSPLAATIAGRRQIIAFTGVALHGIDPKIGALLWSYPWPTQHDANIAMPVVAGDHIFISSGYNHGCAMVKISDAGPKLTVERVFERRNRLLQTQYASCVLLDGHVYGFDQTRGELKCINLRDSKNEVWASEGLRKGNVTLVGDSLLVQTEDGDLVLIDAAPTAYRVKATLKGMLSGGECWATPAIAGGKLYLRDATKVVCLDVVE